MNDDQTNNQPTAEHLTEYQLESIVGGAGPIGVSYPCDICGQSFKSYDMLTNHTNSKHV